MTEILFILAGNIDEYEEWIWRNRPGKYTPKPLYLWSPIQLLGLRLKRQNILPIGSWEYRKDIADICDAMLECFLPDTDLE